VALEIFVIPGFGFVGMIGTLLILVGLTLALLNNVNFNFDFVSNVEIGRSIMVVLIGLTIGFSAIMWLSSRIGSKGIFRQIALETDLNTATSSMALSLLIGKEGIAATVLRPSGKVIIDSTYYDGVSESGFIERGAKVIVTKFENAQVYVELII